MERAELLAHAQNLFTDLANEAGISLADDAGGIERQIDATLRDLGEDTTNAAAGEALIEYHCLRRFRYAVAARVDFDATAVTKKRSQIYEQIDHLITDAAKRCSATGHPMSETAGSQLIRLNLDYLEPEPAELAGIL
jgi:hypothetical protein